VVSAFKKHNKLILRIEFYMKNILVTGANGFLGKSIVSEFITDNVFSLARTSGDYKVLLENEIPILDRNFEVVIHCAGKAHVIPQNDDEKQQFYKVNVLGTLNLLKGLECNEVPKQFVFISSVSVYGRESGINIKEDAPLAATEPYGLSKVRAESEVMEWCKKHNVVCTILRLPLLVGSNPPGNLGKMIKAINRGYYFNIDSGRAKKSMVLAQDVAVLIKTVAPVGGIYNLTDGYHPSFKELSSAISLSKSKKRPLNIPLFIAKIMGVFGDFIGEIAPINSLKVRKITSDLTFDDSKARNLLNWNPISVLEYFKKNPI
jgi:nucleoside-diphosphate-sugar epimerase